MQLKFYKLLEVCPTKPRGLQTPFQRPRAGFRHCIASGEVVGDPHTLPYLCTGPPCPEIACLREMRRGTLTKARATVAVDASHHICLPTRIGLHVAAQ